MRSDGGGRSGPRYDTMVPAQNLLRRYYNSYGGCFGDTHFELHQHKASLRSDPMAEHESRSRSDDEEEEEEGREVGTSSREGDEGWLRLGIGGGSSSGGPRLTDTTVDPTSSSTSQGRGGMMEMGFLSGRQQHFPVPETATASTAVMPIFPAAAATAGLGCSRYMPDLTWGLWNSNPNPNPAASLVSTGVRLVRPPARPQTGVWFVLQAAQYQLKEPFLPQIPKSYLRIKDGRMTVRLLMKYLANKLGLDNESEVEITCRGQPLLPLLTVQYVRDNIWPSREAVVLQLDSSRSDHVMTLQYGRRA